MHSPETVAFDVYLGKKKKRNGKYRSPFITIWHVDPCKNGTDDSCGWFIRLRHADKNVYEKIVKEFESEWDGTFKSDDSGFVYNCGWFSPEGDNILSVQAIVFNMYLYAVKIVIDSNNDNPGKGWNKAWKFMKKHHLQIQYFAENNRDSMRDVIVRKFARGCSVEYTAKKRMEMIRECASIIYTDILRKRRKWYKHPKWHIRHWKIQFHPYQNLKRRYWDKCCICGKRGFKSAAFSDWNGTKRWHQECDQSSKQANNS